MIYMFSLMMMLMVMMMVLMVVLDNKEMNKTATFIWKCKHLNILKMLDENCTANNYFKNDISWKWYITKIMPRSIISGMVYHDGVFFIMLRFFWLSKLSQPQTFVAVVLFSNCRVLQEHKILNSLVMFISVYLVFWRICILYILCNLTKCAAAPAIYVYDII